VLRVGDEIALVDVCVSTVTHVGARALWEVGTLRELYCAFAEPHAVGLSSIAGLVAPTGRKHPDGVRARAGRGRPRSTPGGWPRWRPACSPRWACSRWPRCAPASR